MTCRNCGAPLTGPYCSRCGQQDVDPNRPLRELVGELLDGMVAFDSRVLRTLGPLLSKPGFLTIEYFEGRRARYVPPFKLYLFVSFVFFLVLTLFNVEVIERVSVRSGEERRVYTVGESIVTITENEDAPASDLATSGQADSEANAVGEAAASDEPASAGTEHGQDEEQHEESDQLLGVDLEKALRNESQLQANFLSRLAQVVFLLVPAFAALLKLVYRRSRLLYIQHLVFSLHVHTFGFLVAFVRTLCEQGPVWLGALGALLVGVIPIYVFLALRRFYGQGAAKTLLKMVILGAVHLVVLLVVLLGAFLLAASMA